MKIDPQEHGYLSGKVDEIEERLGYISGRIDRHIAACSARYFGLVSGIVAIGMFILGAVALLIGHIH